MRKTDALERRTALSVQKRYRHPFRHGVEHRNGYFNALIGSGPHNQCFENGFVGIEARSHIDDRNAYARRAFGPSRHRRDAGFSLDQEVVRFALGVRATFAIARNRAANQARILLAQARHWKAELGEGAGLQILHEHVGLLEHGFEQRPVFGLAEVEHHRLLAAIQPDEIGAFAMHNVVIFAGEIALGALHLDDTRTGIGKAACALWRRHRLLNRNYKNTGERQRHLSTTEATRAHARLNTRGSCWSRSAPPDRGAFRGTCARYRIPPQSRIRRGSARTCRRLTKKRPQRAVSPYWLPRRYPHLHRIYAPPHAPSARQRASAHKRARSGTAHPGSARSVA